MAYLLLIIFTVLVAFYFYNSLRLTKDSEIKIILHSFINNDALSNLPKKYRKDYEQAFSTFLQQKDKLNKFMIELDERKEELEVTYNSLLNKSNQLEASNKILEEKVDRLSSINSISKTVLSILDLDKIISTILDAYFVLTNAKRISLYLWEDGVLINKSIKGDIKFRGTLSYPKELLSNFTSEDYRQLYHDLSKGFNINSSEKIMISPLNVKGNELGVIFIIENNSDSTYSDKETINALSIQVAIAINNAQIYAALLIKERISQELEVAAKVQRRIAPKKIEKILGLDISTYFKPAKEVGGDYYDYNLLSEDIFSISIADVSGKGVPAAFLMTIARSVLKTLQLGCIHPEENLAKLNNLIFADITEDMFITMFHSTYDFKTKTLRYSNAGHLPLVVYRKATNQVELHTVKGIAIGFCEDYNFKVGEIQLEIEDIVIFYTDGVTETENPQKELFGTERFKNVLSESSSLSPKEIKSKLLKELDNFKGQQEQNDDITFVIIKRYE